MQGPITTAKTLETEEAVPNMVEEDRISTIYIIIAFIFRNDNASTKNTLWRTFKSDRWYIAGVYFSKHKMDHPFYQL